MPLEPGKPILAKTLTRNLFWRTLTEPSAPQMTWHWNWLSIDLLTHICPPFLYLPNTTYNHH